jgi:3-oxoacyl-[acyl-carrier protein] reductase
MNLGLEGKRALVCASSRGLGHACAMALAREGVHVTITGRDAAALSHAAGDIRAAVPLAQVATVTGDLSTSAGRAAALAACVDPDILVTNNGGPPPGDFRAWSRDDWVQALDMNMLAPIELIKATIDPMIARHWGRIVNITSSAVKSPIPVLGLSNGARAGLTGFVGGLARAVASQGVTINNLLPGPHATDRMRALIDRMGPAALHPMGRAGEPADFGAICAFLCSHHASYVTGQNWLVDGGANPSSM